MLLTLNVQNLALVEKAAIDFAPGLNVITGETGAGKSVLMGALQLLMGERADRSLIRSGAERCSAEAQFDLSDAEFINHLLDEQGVDRCEEGQLILRRVVKTSGGQQFINGCAVTLGVLRELGDALVDMHGPYDHQALLQPRAQLDILDAFGRTEKARTTYAEHYAAWEKLQRRIAELSENRDGLEEQIDLFAYRVREIEEAELREDEEEELLREHTRIGNAHNILEQTQALLQALQEGEPSAFDFLAAAQRAGEALLPLLPEAEVWEQELSGMTAQARELSATINSCAESIEGDPGRLDWLDERLGLYSKLKRKYGPQTSDVLATLENARERLHDLQNRDEQLELLRKDEPLARTAVEAAGKELSKLRKKAAGSLAKKITEQLKDLGFPHGAFAVDLLPQSPARSGLDEVVFGFEPNPGECMRPLREIASSGEISRVMLAVKAVLAVHDRVPVMVFDEIDANVGGEMGNAIGKKMQEAARHRQVITITHLPQVAVFGSHHLAVRKEVSEGRTYTRVAALVDSVREEEIARMLGGKDLTPSTLQHARDMLAGMQNTTP